MGLVGPDPDRAEMQVEYFGDDEDDEDDHPSLGSRNGLSRQPGGTSGRLSASPTSGNAQNVIGGWV